MRDHSLLLKEILHYRHIRQDAPTSTRYISTRPTLSMCSFHDLYILLYQNNQNYNVKPHSQKMKLLKSH